MPNNGEYAIIKELEGASRPKADCFVTARARSAQNRTVRKNFLGGVRRKPDGQTLADSNRRPAAFETNRRHDGLKVCLAKGGMAKHTQKRTRQNGSLDGGLFFVRKLGNMGKRGVYERHCWVYGARLYKFGYREIETSVLNGCFMDWKTRKLWLLV